MERDESILIRAEAEKAYKNALAIYSGYKVGAALLASSGKIYKGCNVESSSYGLSVCAERNAVANAVVNGERKFIAIGIYSDNGALPCGACRQVLWDVCGDIKVYIFDTRGSYKTLRLSELFPFPFDSEKLKERESK